jgi:predicted nucleotidyltransferase
MENIELINRRLKRTGRLAVILQWVPFLRCLILNGSLAQGSAKESSDIDILVIAKSGRIYTARFFINSFTSLLGLKRSSKKNKSHGGKFCFNYYLSTNFLIIPINRGKKMDQYCARNYGCSILIWGKQKLFQKFFEENKELFSMIQKSKVKSQNCNLKLKTQFPVQIIHLIFIVGRILEFFLNGWWGDRLENWLKKYQIFRIEKDERTKKYPELIVYNDRELRFHPPKNDLLKD